METTIDYPNNGESNGKENGKLMEAGIIYVVVAGSELD